MRHNWWAYFGLVGMVWACGDGTPPAQQPPGAPPHPYVQPPPGPQPRAVQPIVGVPTAHGTTPTSPVAPGAPPKQVPAAKPTARPPATPYDTPTTKPPTAPPSSTAPTTPYDPPGAGPTTPAPGGVGRAQGKAAGSPCSVAKECESNICEGQGCGYNAGRCAPKNRRCTRDLVAYCSCSGQTYGASGTCPGRIYRHKGVCKK